MADHISDRALEEYSLDKLAESDMAGQPMNVARASEMAMWRP